MNYYKVGNKIYTHICDVHGQIETLAHQIMDSDDPLPDAIWKAADDIESLAGIAMRMGQSMEQALKESSQC